MSDIILEGQDHKEMEILQGFLNNEGCEKILYWDLMRINFFVNNFLRGFRIGVNIPGAFLDEICKYFIEVFNFQKTLQRNKNWEITFQNIFCKFC